MITNENYFSPENNMKYMSVSQVKQFMNCEAMAMAELKGEFQREKTTSLMVGSFVDAHFSKELDLFKAQNPDIFTKQGTLKSEYKQAENIIARIERDPLFMSFISGEIQAIKIGEINGIPFKIKIDSYHPGQSIVDLKIMRDFEPVWKEGSGRINFIEGWNYDLQGAVYQRIEGNNLPFYIAAATKEKEPDIAIYHIPQRHLDMALELVIDKLPRFQAIKNGEIEPDRCGKCDYCKSTKVLAEPISLEDLIYE